MRIALFGLVGLILILLKLIGVIDWSWWLVTAPIWGTSVILVVGFLVLVLLEFTARR